jgi:hypothetical protein
MVHHVHHYSHSCVGCRPKWCTGCTNHSGFRNESRQNGAPDAPFSRFRRAMTTKMVYQMHQSFCFSSLRGLKWRTTCTIIPIFVLAAVQNGALDAPITGAVRMFSARMVHYVHQYAAIRARRRLERGWNGVLRVPILRNANAIPMRMVHYVCRFSNSWIV